LCCIAAGITGQRDFAEDIVQQAIAIAVEKDLSFESNEQFAIWLAEIVRRCALNHRRKTRRRKTYPVDPTNLTRFETNELHDSSVNKETGDLLAFQSSFDDALVKALQRLSPRARSCLLLRTIENLNYGEIARLMQISEGTAMSLVHRSKKTLRELLGPLVNPAGLDRFRSGARDND
jgi:RNA polymerase sigma-70 factor (ECF subfamily)